MQTFHEVVSELLGPLMIRSKFYLLGSDERHVNYGNRNVAVDIFWDAESFEVGATLIWLNDDRSIRDTISVFGATAISDDDEAKSFRYPMITKKEDLQVAINYLRPYIEKYLLPAADDLEGTFQKAQFLDKRAAHNLEKESKLSYYLPLAEKAFSEKRYTEACGYYEPILLYLDDLSKKKYYYADRHRTDKHS